MTARTGRATAWGVSLVATLVSTYALDATATASGLLLAASGVLDAASRPLLLAVLGLSYVVWAVGLRTNLRQNHALLSRTGTSTNVLSKAAHDIAAARSAGPRVSRFAAAAGYVTAELVKEVPYYAGAFGATVLTDSVSSADAIVFLAGANLGAGAYEHGLARLTHLVLARRYSSFEADWAPRHYLADYYAAVEPDEVETIAFFVDALERSEPGEPVLFFGVGPTLHHVFLAATTASELHLGDYLPGNLEEIQRWIDRDPSAHDWRPFVRYTLQCEGIRTPSEEQVTVREELTRSKITRLLHVDGRVPMTGDIRYATVVSGYCADSATRDRPSWRPFMRNIMGRVRPGGLFVTAALRHSRGYVVGGHTFPSADVDETDVLAVLEGAWGPLRGTVETRKVADQAAHGYSGIVLAWARQPD
ncbi:guanitoxin biosynthesis pre-guanitoxin forming N-methyltransferase GntF [Microvirga sp. 0TCS3.31]